MGSVRVASAYAFLLESDPSDAHSGSRAQCSLHRGVEVRLGAFECNLVLTSCASETRGTKVSLGTLQRGVEVGWAAFECRLVLTGCASETRGTKVIFGALHGGVEVGWAGFETPEHIHTDSRRGSETRNGVIRAAGTLQRGVEVGSVAFELILVLTICASETRSKNVSERALQRGVEVGWDVSEWPARTQLCSKQPKRCPQRESSAMGTSAGR